MDIRGALYLICSKNLSFGEILSILRLENDITSFVLFVIAVYVVFVDELLKLASLPSIQIMQPLLFPKLFFISYVAFCFPLAGATLNVLALVWIYLRWVNQL